MARKLGQKQINEFRVHFEQELEKILSSYQKKRDDKNEVDVDGDETDLIQGNMLSSIDETLSKRDKDRIQKIRNALKRIEQGTFGICEECEGTIVKARLLARPEAELCISCAEKAEYDAKNFIRK